MVVRREGSVSGRGGGCGARPMIFKGVDVVVKGGDLVTTGHLSANDSLEGVNLFECASWMVVVAVLC